MTDWLEDRIEDIAGANVGADWFTDPLEDIGEDLPAIGGYLVNQAKTTGRQLDEIVSTSGLDVDRPVLDWNGKERKARQKAVVAEGDDPDAFANAPKITEDNHYRGPGLGELAASWQMEAEGKLSRRVANRQRRHLAKVAARLKADPEQADAYAAYRKRLDQIDQVIAAATPREPMPVTEITRGHVGWLTEKGRPQVDDRAAQQVAGAQAAADPAAAAAVRAEGGENETDDFMKGFTEAGQGTVTSEIPLLRPRIDKGAVSEIFQAGGTVGDLMGLIDRYHDRMGAYDAELAGRGQLPGAGPTSRFNPQTGKHDVLSAAEGGGPGGEVGPSAVDLTATNLNYQQPLTDAVRPTAGADAFSADPQGYAAAQAYGGHMSLRSALALPITKTAPEIISLQNLLIRSGFMPARVVTENEINFGQYDTPTMTAWHKAIMASYQNPEVPLVDMLNQRAASYAPQLAAQLAEGAGGSKLVINLSDPAMVRTSSNTIAQRLIQRDLSPMEQEKLTAYVHSLQRAEGYDRQDSTYTEVDPIAQLEEAIRANFDEEVQGTSAANAFKIMSEHFGGIA